MAVTGTDAFTLTNAAIVLPDRVVAGSVRVAGGVIADVQPGAAAGEDMDGDYLIPGAVDLHTDNLERQAMPRQDARWPSRAALLAHDAQCAAAGVTTVFDALCVGHAGLDEDRPRTCMEGLADLAALAPSGLLKAEHFLHLRCELPASGLMAQLEAALAWGVPRVASLMDHTPGVGQFGDLTRYRAMRRRDGESAAETEVHIAGLLAQRAAWRDANRDALLARLGGLGVVLASHDDETAAEVAENLADGIGVSEFPVSLEAAQAAKAAGMAVIAGAPNLVRGGSHSGNVGASALLAEGLVDALASDYVPASLVHAAFVAGVGLPEAVGMISAAPARLAGLTDRGAIAVGLRADLVRVRVFEGVAVVRQVWRGGVRVA